ncbi:hypothetical protein [Marinicrinis lubricantis]|uniref:Phosphoglyceromutase n=1 Tax=Marinicrinis lubricantis TaxID=2086470 RepID=A0ABW1IRD5_9BACL
MYVGEVIDIKAFIRIKVFIVWILYILFTLTIPYQAMAEEVIHNTGSGISMGKKTIWIVSVPGLSFLEIHPDRLRSYPHLEQLFTSGAIGGVNVRTPERGVEDSYLTMGAGHSVIARSTFSFYMQDEPMDYGFTASSYYEMMTGSIPRGKMILPSLPALLSSNRASLYEGRPGLLGNVLAANGVDVYVYGNRDQGLAANEGLALRQAPMMVMNDRGEVDGGNIGTETLKTNVSRPFGLQTNIETIWNMIDQEVMEGASNRSQVVMIELGDLDRLYAWKSQYDEEQFSIVKHQIMKEIDEFIAELMLRMESEDQLWLISPLPHSTAIRQKYLLVPLALYGKSIQPGLLTSETTRRDGMISNYDIAPTLLMALNIDDNNRWIGTPAAVVPENGHFRQLSEEIKGAADVYRMRPKQLYPFVTYEVTVMLIAFVLILNKRTAYRKWKMFFLYSLLTAPVCMLWEGWFYKQGEDVMGILLIAMTLLSAALWTSAPFYIGLAGVSGTTLFFLLFDGFTGAHAIQHSVLGYDAMIGARYYGIGNEYMGVLIGSAVLCTTALLQFMTEKHKKGKSIAILTAAIYVILLIYLVLPNFGTNAGGAITAAVTFIVAWQRMARPQPGMMRWRSLALWLSAGAAAALILLWLANQLLSISEQSHIGKAMTQIESGNIGYISKLILRKIQMNLHLLGVSSWSKVLVASVLIVPLLLLRPKGKLKQWQHRYPYLMGGFTATAIGSVIALLVNDSGIVAAATMIVFAAVPMLMLKFYEDSASHCS